MWRRIIRNRIKKSIRTGDSDFILGRVKGANILLASPNVGSLILLVRSSPGCSRTMAISLSPPGLLHVEIRRSIHMVPNICGEKESTRQTKEQDNEDKRRANGFPTGSKRAKRENKKSELSCAERKGP